MGVNLLEGLVNGEGPDMHEGVIADDSVYPSCQIWQRSKFDEWAPAKSSMANKLLPHQLHRVRISMNDHTPNPLNEMNDSRFIHQIISVQNVPSKHVPFFLLSFKPLALRKRIKSYLNFKLH